MDADVPTCCKHVFGRFEVAASFDTVAQGKGYRIGLMMTNAQPGDHFFLEAMCWRRRIPRRGGASDASDSVVSQDAAMKESCKHCPHHDHDRSKPPWHCGLVPPPKSS
jgi:hypothetical protein